MEEMFVTGEAGYPYVAKSSLCAFRDRLSEKALEHRVERVLLTSGVLEAALTGRYEQVGAKDGARDPMPMEDDGTRNVVGERMLTPWLDVCYRSYEKLPHRPLGPRPAGALVTTMDDRRPPAAPRL